MIIFKDSGGPPCGVNIDYTVRQGRVVLLLKNKSLSDKKFQIMSMYGTKMWVLNLDGYVTIVPCLFQKAAKWCKINEKVS